MQLLQLSAWKPTCRPASTLAADRDDVAPEARGYSDGDVGDGRSALDHDVPGRTPPCLQNPLGALGGSSLLARGASPKAETSAARTIVSRTYPAHATPLDVARAAGAKRAIALLEAGRPKP